ncbi:putative ATP:guanido phosphotransferase [Peptoclostridium acidaminophilum DSM 3953]|uniref:Protein-arginine kinase n=1 Tax=Peptoclostridium acidaminophilum DSM 3953 TaxID=1286171 RepID=W8T3Q1_PEPAC|nr:protein arginine kinase [Peptoclostridium acidaminophilum]AHM55455.1 putative ATP:guanido phosphotransferase [Peptoclostridium acidaminophilum DSM 3953]
MIKWLELDGAESEVVISSRIRLARNFSGYNFTNKLKPEEAESIIKEVENAIIYGTSAIRDDFKSLRMAEIDKLEKGILLEKHLISRDIAKSELSAALVKDDETVSIMVNEEDHIRIQALFPGFRLDDAWDIADKIDDLLEERVGYAFDERLGYLTACPTNVGTGMRASIMMHLPALVELGYIDGVLKAANQIGLAVRGIYGEGSQAKGSIFQISNQLTLGRKEEEILGNIKGLSKQLISKELEARSFLHKNHGMKFEDKIYRSLGILKSARTIDSNEAMNLLSNVKLGIEMGLIDDMKSREIDKLFIEIQPAHQQSMSGQNKAQERDVKRAEYLRKELSQNINEDKEV